MAKKGKTILYLAAAIFLSLPVVSCRSTSHNTHTYRPYSERRNRGGEPNDDITTTTSKTDKQKPEPGGYGLVDEKWAALDVKLSRKDNKKLYKELKSWLGTPYAHAGQEKGVGTDCSGMVMKVYQEVYGIQLNRNSAKILEQNCRVIDLDDLREGDLVFFCTSSDGRVSHVGIYLRENKFVHASSSRGVCVDDLRQNYYATRFYSAGRVNTSSR